MKNLVILAVASSALMVGTAQAALQHGFEVGARAGYMWQHDEDLNVSGRFSTGEVYNNSHNLHDNGGLAGVFVGYNWVCNDLLLGLDLSADWIDADDRHDYLARDNAGNNYLNSARFDRDFMYGISGRMGYRAWDFMTPFVRLGIERVDNNLDYDLDYVDVNPAQRQLGIAKSSHETGYLVGLGMDIPVFNKNTNVRIEYQYHWQNRADYDFVNVGNTFSGHADMKPKAHFLTIGLLWSQV
jgi:hypothetical protein